MKPIKRLILISILIFPFSLNAQNLRMRASQFGIRSDGTTMNTTSMQRAIDYIHEHGGGTLEFYVGRYLTGSVHLKSDVHIYLDEAAVLVGSTNVYDYWNGTSVDPLIGADHQENIGITGKGVIDGRGRELACNITAQVNEGLIKDKMNLDRPGCRPNIIIFSGCKNVEIKGIILKNACSWVQLYSRCEQMVIDGITVDSKAFWNNDGLDIDDCSHVKVLNSFIDAADDAICFKSADTAKVNEDIEIRNCVARSSANGIKFGSNICGTYKNFRIVNNKVYDTYRSAVNIASVDGGVIDNILVDSLYAVNVGNAIFVRCGARNFPGRHSELKNVTIQNVYAEVAATKPDAGYDYEGPVEDLPRNVSPCGIVGLPDRKIENISLKNIEIVHPGGGDPFYAKAGTAPEELDAIPEIRNMYPDFSKFKELPAWGFFIRHVKGLEMENITLTAKKKDYRPSIVMVDIQGGTLEGMMFNEPSSKGKEQIIQYKSNVSIKK